MVLDAVSQQVSVVATNQFYRAYRDCGARPVWLVAANLMRN